MNGFPGACRVHRAEILRLNGDWPLAEKTALAACGELQDFDRRVTAGGYYEVGEIRRRRGDFAAADEAFRTANELGRPPQPGLALLHLTEGKVESAVAGIQRALSETHEPLLRLRALPAQVEIAIAAADVETARAAADELEQIVDAFKIGDHRAPAFDAQVHLARGQIELAEKDWGGAASSLARARDEWLRVGAPYEVAQARTALAVAFRRQGDEHGATAELQAALATFEKLGARLDQERVEELLGRVEGQRTFLFTDIVGSTELLESLGDADWRKLLARHDELVRDAIVRHGGSVIKQTGDGFFARFDDPAAAIAAAIDVQRALTSEDLASQVRIGAHTGGAFKTGANYTDYGGQSVHIAARIGAAAGAGEILVSRDTLEGTDGRFRSRRRVPSRSRASSSRSRSSPSTGATRRRPPSSAAAEGTAEPEGDPPPDVHGVLVALRRREHLAFDLADVRADRLSDAALAVGLDLRGRRRLEVLAVALRLGVRHGEVDDALRDLADVL